MALLNIKSTKSFYTQADDELIIKMKGEKKSNKEISAAVGHSEASINYRIQRVLSKHDDFSEIKYKA